MSTKLKKQTDHYIENCDGNIAVITSMTFLVLLLAIGSALDLRNLVSHKNNMQNALDSAVLAAASSSSISTSDIEALANLSFAQNIRTPCDTLPIYQFKSGEVVGSVTCSLKPNFVHIFGYEMLSTTVGSAAAKNIQGSGICVHALDPTANRTFLASGSSNINADGCSVQIDSSNAEAVTLSGGSTMTSDENCIVGGIKQGESNMTPPPPLNCEPVGDPFSSYPKPSVGACDYWDFNEDTDMILNPGVYCGGLRAANAEFTFNPGLYIIQDGIFESTGGATLNGDGVTFFLTGSEAGLVWGGGGTYNFKAMSTGDLAGFIVYLDPDAAKEDKSVVSGGGDIFYEGMFYFPQQTLLISGGGSVTTSSNFTAYVANIIEYTGGGTLDIKIDPAGTSVPIPRGLFKNSPSGLRLTR